MIEETSTRSVRCNSQCTLAFSQISVLYRIVQQPQSWWCKLQQISVVNSSNYHFVNPAYIRTSKWVLHCKGSTVSSDCQLYYFCAWKLRLRMWLFFSHILRMSEYYGEWQLHRTLFNLVSIPWRILLRMVSCLRNCLQVEHFCYPSSALIRIYAVTLS